MKNKEIKESVEIKEEKEIIICGNCNREATHEAGGVHRCDRCND